MTMTLQPQPTAQRALLGDLADRLHLWVVPVDAALDPAWVDDNRSLLSADEAVRCDRYLRQEDADLFFAAHVAVRRILSHYRDVRPADWRFATNAHGRPEIANDGAPAWLRFNLTHTPGLVAVVVHDQNDSGVDAELIGRVDDPIAMSRTVFSDAEREELLAFAPAVQERAFHRLWTLKESFIKAKGMGLAIPLKEMSFSGFAEGGHLMFGCEPAVDPDPGAWDFTIRTVDEQHLVATATRRGVGGSRPVHVINTNAATW